MIISQKDHGNIQGVEGLESRNLSWFCLQEFSIMKDECSKLRQENYELHQKTRQTINIKEHEDQVKKLGKDNKELTEKLDSTTYECRKQLRILESELEEFRIKVGKRDLEITQIECENKVLKKMIGKYEDLVHGLRLTVSNQQVEIESNQNRLKSKHRSSSLQDVTQKEMKLLERINDKLTNLKVKVTRED